MGGCWNLGIPSKIDCHYFSWSLFKEKEQERKTFYWERRWKGRLDKCSFHPDTPNIVSAAWNHSMNLLFPQVIGSLNLTYSCNVSPSYQPTTGGSQPWLVPMSRRTPAHQWQKATARLGVTHPRAEPKVMPVHQPHLILHSESSQPLMACWAVHCGDHPLMCQAFPLCCVWEGEGRFLSAHLCIPSP